MGNAEAASMLPREIDDLADLDIVDVSVGDSHCLALVKVYMKNFQSDDPQSLYFVSLSFGFFYPMYTTLIDIMNL